MKSHILRPDSITPIALYIDRQLKAPDSYLVQLEFACVLLYREREYRGMNSAMTAILTVGANGVMPSNKNDLFGLKDAASTGLRRARRPVKSERVGWLVYASLLTDLGRYGEAMPAADEAIALGEHAQGRALTSA